MALTVHCSIQGPGINSMQDNAAAMRPHAIVIADVILREPDTNKLVSNRLFLHSNLTIAAVRIVPTIPMIIQMHQVQGLSVKLREDVMTAAR